MPLLAAALSILCTLTLVSCQTPPIRGIRRIEFVRTLFSDRDHVSDFRNMKSFFSVAKVPASGNPSPLSEGPQIDLPTTFDFRGARLDTISFLTLTDTTGLIIIKDD